jgi:hypothetical protein
MGSGQHRLRVSTWTQAARRPPMAAVPMSLMVLRTELRTILR